VLIVVLLVSERTVEKLAGHQISADEVRQVSDGDPQPAVRVHGSVLMIGPTHGGRILTVVLNPDLLDEAPACPHGVACERRADRALPAGLQAGMM